MKAPLETLIIGLTIVCMAVTVAKWTIQPSDSAARQAKWYTSASSEYIGLRASVRTPRARMI